MLNKLKPKSEFSRNVLTLMTGTTIAQAIPIAISPILTRIYTPQDFGIFALYMAISSIIAVVATGRYEMAIMLPRKDNDAINIVVLSIIISFFITFISLFIVFIFNKQITYLLGNPEISRWLYFIPITILFTGIYQSINYWSNRKKQYKRLATSRVIQSGVTASANLSIGYNSFTNGLIIGGIIGQVISTLLIATQVYNENKLKLIEIKKLKIYAMAKKYIKFPKNSSIGALFNVVSYQAEIILLGIFYTSHFLGLYYFINKFVDIPKQFLSTSIWQIFLSNSGKKPDDIFNAKYYKQKKIIIYTTFPMIYGIFFYGDIFIFIFGNNWENATIFILPLVLSMNVNFVVSSFSLFVIINNPNAEMIFNILLALFKILSIVISHIIFENIFYTIISFSIIQFIMFYILGSWNYKQLDKSYLFFTKLYFPCFLFSILLLFFSELLFSEVNLISKIFIYLLVLGAYFGVIKYAKI